MAFYGDADSLGYVQITCDTATGINLPSGGQYFVAIAEGAPVRWRDDGTNPTAAIGMPLAIGQVLEYTANDYMKLKFIQQSAIAKVNITFYGKKP